MLDLFTDTEADLGRELGEARIFIFNFTAGSVSAAYGTVIVLAIAFGIAAIGALLYYGLQSMSSAGYGYGADTYSYSRSQTRIIGYQKQSPDIYLDLRMIYVLDYQYLFNNTPRYEDEYYSKKRSASDDSMVSRILSQISSAVQKYSPMETQLQED